MEDTAVNPRFDSEKMGKRLADNVEYYSVGEVLGFEDEVLGFEDEVLSFDDENPHMKASRLINTKPLKHSYPRLISALYNHIKEKFVYEAVNASNVINLIMFVMVLVENQKNLTGYQKKGIVVYLVELFIEEISGDKEDKLALQSAVQLLLPSIVDTIITATRGQFDLNKDGIVTPDEIAEVSANCWSACISCFNS